LALQAGFPLGWLASDSSLLIPESQCLPPSSPEARVVILIPLCGRSILRRKRCEVEEGDRSPPPRMRAARPRPRACSRAPSPASPSFFSESAEDHIASLALLLRIVKRFPVFCPSGKEGARGASWSKSRTHGQRSADRGYHCRKIPLPRGDLTAGGSFWLRAYPAKWIEVREGSTLRDKAGPICPI